MRGILFDLARRLAGAEEKPPRQASPTVSPSRGQLFRISAFRDVYLLKSIVHDWNVSARDSQNMPAAMYTESRLVVLEKLAGRIEDPSEALPSVMSDLNMMVVLGGKERTPDEYRELLAGAGLRMTRFVPNESEFAAIEAVVA